ncbi:MAG: Ada metal-binding domain-containing protein [Acidimicrobiales bacterium]
MILDDDSRYRAVASRDPRFDGWFFVGVTSTGIFCRPSCPATTPRRANVRFFATAAAAQGAGFRACRRCRPDTAPGSPAWNGRGDLAARAVALIDDGTIDREGVGGVARRLAVSERHLHRVLVAELGAAPLALARARRAHTARLLIETTALPITDIAFAAGFASVRQFNDTVREAFGANPSTLRRDRASTQRGRGGPSPTPGGAGAHPTAPLALRLAARAPFAGGPLVGFLGERAVLGVEAFEPDGTYRRVLALPRGPAVVALRPRADPVEAQRQLADLRDLGPAVARCRRVLDLDADPVAVDGALATDPVLAPLVAAVPGRRAPGAVDGMELLVRAIVGQQVSVAGARTIAGRLAEALGAPSLRPSPPAPTPWPGRSPPQTRSPVPTSPRSRCPGRARRSWPPRRRWRRASSTSTPAPTGSRWSGSPSRSAASAPGRRRTSPCGPRRPRRLPPDRPGRAARPRGARARRVARRGGGGGRGMASLALLRPAPPLGGGLRGLSPRRAPSDRCRSPSRSTRPSWDPW